MTDFLSLYSVIKSFLIANKAEITNMCITEYDEVKTMNEQRLEGRREGLLETLIGLVRDGLLPAETAADRAGMTLSEFEKQSVLYHY